MEHLEEIILDYVNTDTSNNYAVMITGDWGSGKTFYFKETLKGKIEQTGKELLYVSLNGLRKPADIFNELIAERYRIAEFFGKTKTGKIAYGALQSAFKIGVGAMRIISGVGETAKEINIKPTDLPSIAIQELVSFSKEKHVLCFDDLERVSAEFKTEDVLGFINRNFVEHEGIKVIIICNEKEIIPLQGTRDQDQGKKDNEGENKYYQIKEKLIGRTLQFKSNPVAVFNAFIDLYEREKRPGHEFFSDNRAYLQRKLSLSGEQNLRTLLFMLDNLELITERIDSRYRRQLSRELILSTILFSFEEKRGNLGNYQSVEDLPWVLQANSNDVVMVSDGMVLDILTDNPEDNNLGEEESEKKKRKAYRDYLKKNYWGDDTYHFFPAIFTFVKTGYLDADKLNSELSELMPKEEPPHLQVLNKIKQSYNLSDAEFNECLPQLIQHIEKGDYNLAEFIEGAKVLHDLSSSGVIKGYSKDTLNAFLLKNIDKTRREASTEDLKAIKKAKGFLNNPLIESENLLEEINRYQSLIASELKTVEINENLRVIRETDYMTLERESFRDIIIYHSLESIQEVIQQKFNDNPNKLMLIIDLFDHTYPTKHSISNTVLPQESEKLKNIAKWVDDLQESISTEDKPISKYWVKALSVRLTKIVDSLEIREERVTRFD
ncbi:P-loop NTPase fold protein [Phaeodactylibacter xiamenensis]|uniref:P-loop NTPase fold protein n=1 Tax=Phaeodactylibacter xiamenensis TaxID=1524460 RepID=UPI003BAB18E9